MKNIKINSSFEDSFVMVNEKEISKLLDDISSTFGYKPLEEYFNRFDTSNGVFVCLLERNGDKPHLLISIHR